MKARPAGRRAVARPRLTCSGDAGERLAFEALARSMYQRLNAERAGIRAVIVGGPPPPAR